MEDCKETKSWVCYTDGSKLGENTTDGGNGGYQNSLALIGK